jgi:serine/threonine-protein kinase PknG
VLNRYVVLKGLLNSEDEASAAVAVAERQFLAAVKHANIVSIYNFVNHGTEGFIIMEYIGGQTLKEIRKTRGPLPVAEAIAYIHRILASFSYLHQQGLVYCDFKPDNIMLEDGDVKLIDLGGVRRAADLDGDIYGTVGYTAPEAGEGPTVVSDLFTIGRTLAVLLANIPQFTQEFQYRLPTPADVALFAQEESLYRFLLKATAENPDDRFQSADEMAQQLLGVLREVVARQTGQPQTTNSQFFTGDALPFTAQNPLENVGMDLAQLPNPTLPNDDPAFTELVKIISLRDLSQQLKSLESLKNQYPNSRATKCKIVETIQDIFLMAVSSNFLSQADQILAELEQEDLWDWRVPWYRGRTLMLKRQFGQARQSFEQVWFDLPGELAPKLALAMASEASQEYAIAAKYYNNVLSTDLSYPSAAFGLARCLMHQGQRSPAVAALQKVPQTSTLYNHAKVAITRILVETQPGIPAVQDIQTAANLVKTISLDLMDQNRLKRQVMENALHLLQAKQISPNGIALFDQPFEEVKLRSGLESVLREMARLSTGEEKIRLVEEANRVRPRTLF